MKVGVRLERVGLAAFRCFLGGLLACGYFPSRLTPHKELLGVRVLVDPDVALTWIGSDDECATHKYAEKQALLDSLRTGLSAGGFEVVSASGAPHEAVARISEHCTGASSGEAWRSVTVVLEPGGHATAGSTYGAVSQLVEMPPVLALGRRKTEAPSPPAHAKASVTPTAASHVSASSAPTADAPGGSRASLPSASPQPDAFAVVIGIEKYSHLPTLTPTGARADAQQFAELAQHSLGVPSDHIKVALDAEATKGTIHRLIAWARDGVPPEGRIYFYFSGHGAPDASTGTPYIMPSDGDPEALTETALAESDVLAELSSSKAKDVLAVLESCFSGAGGRSVLPPGARVLDATGAPPGRTAVFTATSGAEVSGPRADGSGGAFTQYLVQGLGTGAADIDGDGQITLQELNEWVSPRVIREAKRDNRNQHPGLVLSRGLGAPSEFVVEGGPSSK